jgi:hypothetical protein
MTENELQFQNQQLRDEIHNMRLKLLDQFAIAALSSGRYAHNQIYPIAQQCLQERKQYV